MSHLTATEREALARFKRGYQASTTTETDRQTGNRVAFTRWLVDRGILNEGIDAAPWCIRCRHNLNLGHRPVSAVAYFDAVVRRAADLTPNLYLVHPMPCGMPQAVAPQWDGAA